MKKSEIAVLGAGNGGLAIAGNLALKKFKVNLYSPFANEVALIKLKGGIQLEGAIKGFGELNLVTTNIEKAIKNTEIIMVVAPAFAHAQIAKNCAPHLQDGQIIVLNPGRTGGALEFNHVLEKTKIKADITIAETNTLIYACRKDSSNKVLIHGVKNEVLLAALPTTKTEKVIKKVRRLFSQFKTAKNIFQTGFGIGPIFHPAIMISHCDKITKKENFYFYDIDEETAEILEILDKERLKIGEAFGVKLDSAEYWLEKTYSAKGKTLHAKITTNKAYRKIKGPKYFNVRQIDEDVPFGLVPMYYLAELTGIKCICFGEIISCCSFLRNRVFYLEGRDLENLGLSGMNINEIKEFVKSGRR